MDTVVLTGIPKSLELEVLESNLKKLMRTRNIGDFKIRAIQTPYRTSKRVLAMDFEDEDDAAIAASMLNDLKFKDFKISAKITKHPKFMPPLNFNPEMPNKLEDKSNKESEIPVKLLLAIEKYKKMYKRLKKKKKESNDSDDKSDKKSKKRKKKKKKRLSKQSSSTSSSNASGSDSEEQPSTSKTYLNDRWPLAMSPQRKKSPSQQSGSSRNVSSHSINAPLNPNEFDSSAKSKSGDKQNVRKRDNSPLSPGEIRDTSSDESSSGNKKSLRFKTKERGSLSPKDVASKRSPIAKSPVDEYRRSRFDLSVRDKDRNQNRDNIYERESRRRHSPVPRRHLSDSRSQHSRSRSKDLEIDKQKRPSRDDIRRPRVDDDRNRYNRSLDRKINNKDRTGYRGKEGRRQSPIRSRTSSVTQSYRRCYATKESINDLRKPKASAYENKFYNIHATDAREKIVKEIHELFESASKGMQMSLADRDLIKAQLKNDIEMRFKRLEINPQMTLDEVLALYKTEHSMASDKVLITKYIDEVFNLKRKFQGYETVPNLSVMARPSLKTELDDIWTIVDEVFQELLILKAAETRNYQLKLNITKSNEPNHPLNAKKEKLVISPKLKFAIPCKNIRRTMKRLIKSLNLPDDKRKAFDVALRRSLRHRLRVIMKDKPYMSGGDVTKLYRDVHPKVDDEDFLKDLYERLENGEFDNYVDSDAENDKEHAVDVNVETNKEIEENKLAYDATSEYEPSDSEGLTSNKKTMELQSKAEMLLQESFKIKGIISVGLDESDFEDPILIKSDTDEVDNDIEIVESREIPEKKSSALFVSADFKGPTPAKETTDVLANVSKVLNENNEDNQNKEFEDNEEVNDGNENVDAATTELELADNADGARSISLIEKTLRTKLKINLLPASSKQLTQPKDMTKYNFEE